MIARLLGTSAALSICWSALAQDRPEGERKPSDKPTEVTFEKPRPLSYLVSFPRHVDLQGADSESREKYPMQQLQGTVVIPPDHQVLIYYQPSPRGPADLSFQDQFQPDDIHSLHVGATSVSARELERLQRHTALEKISLGPLNEASIADLAPLKEVPSLASVAITGPAVKGRVAKFVTEIRKCGPLRALNLQETETTDHDLRPLRGDENLEVLSLQDTKVSDEGLAHLAEIPNLRRLNLNRTNVTDEGLRHLAKLSRLRELELAGTNVTGASLRHLWQLPQLDDLFLPSTKLSDHGAAGLAGLKNLRKLYLQKTQITDAALRHLSGLENLEWLELWENDIGGEGLKHLSNLRNLQHLNVALTSIGDDALKHLHSLKSLEYVLLPEKNVTRDGYEMLKAALPDTFVGSMDSSLRKGKR